MHGFHFHLCFKQKIWVTCLSDHKEPMDQKVQGVVRRSFDICLSWGPKQLLDLYLFVG